MCISWSDCQYELTEAVGSHCSTHKVRVKQGTKHLYKNKLCYYYSSTRSVVAKASMSAVAKASMSAAGNDSGVGTRHPYK